ncbi:hypothetical protein AGOR_G00016890 [Albula goreensis]|uniref:Uncharacterized protein n=1 Tax=Albula goreensis TaxID=1534307 RepID=A0A8T3E4H6_9TELE|nr:hypothetical protein AGOR_G00016890 [Albula goreensis]
MLWRVLDGASQQIRVYDSKGTFQDLQPEEMNVLSHVFGQPWDLRSWRVTYPSQWLDRLIKLWSIRLHYGRLGVCTPRHTKRDRTRALIQQHGFGAVITDEEILAIHNQLEAGTLKSYFKSRWD